MSYVSVDEVKVALVFDIDEDRLQMAIDDAEDEAVQYLNMNAQSLEEGIAEMQATSDSTGVPGDAGNFNSIRRAVILLTQCYVDDVTPDDAEKKRKAAEILMFPYRRGLGC